MASLETQRNNEELLDQSLTSPDDVDVSDDALVDSSVYRGQTLSQETLLHFLNTSKLSDNKQAKKRIKELDSNSSLRKDAELYMTEYGFLPAIALKEAEAKEMIDSLSSQGWVDAINTIKEKGYYLPTEVLGQIAKKQEELQDYSTDNIVIANQKAKTLMDAIFENPKYKHLSNNDQIKSMSPIEQKKEVDAFNQLDGFIQKIGWRINTDTKGVKTVFAPNDHEYAVKIDYENGKPTKTLEELFTKNRIYELGQKYESDGMLRTVVYNVYYGKSLSGNEVDIYKRKEKEIMELLEYAKNYDKSLVSSPESIALSWKDVGEDLNDIDTIYGLEKNVPLINLLKEGTSPMTVLQRGRDDELASYLDPKFVRKHGGREDVTSSIKQGII